MSLSARFSLLFLSALAVILVGFSTALAFAARRVFDRQVHDRLVSTLDVLASAAEVDSDGVEWEPRERVLPVGLDPGPDQVRWMVFDPLGRPLDHSRNLDRQTAALWSPPPGSSSLPSILTDSRGLPWRTAQRQVGLQARSPASQHLADDDLSPHLHVHPALTLTAYAPLAPSQEALATLHRSLLLGGLGFWFAAALLCRGITRQALAPLARMAQSAHSLDASDPGWSLETSGTADELEDLGRAFNDLLDRLHLAYERQRRFSADASHQLRTPLTVLIGQIEVALRRQRSADEYQRVLQSALGRAHQLHRIVEALLFLNRAERDSPLPETQPLNLALWAAEHLASHPSETPGSNIILQNLDPSGPLILGQPALLDQLLSNLLENAEKHGTPGAPILVQTLRDGASAILAVENQGPSIPDDDLTRVFHPFYRSALARQQGIPGVGLGLAIVERIARALGGSACLARPSAPGCRVEVRLPRLSADQETANLPASHSSSDSSSSSSSSSG